MTFLLFDAFGTLVELDDFYGRLQRGFAQLNATRLDATQADAAHNNAARIGANSMVQNSTFENSAKSATFQTEKFRSGTFQFEEVQSAATQNDSAAPDARDSASKKRLLAANLGENAANRVLDSSQKLALTSKENTPNRDAPNRDAPITIPLAAIRRAAHREMRHYIAHSLRAHQQENWESLRHECAQILADALREENAAWDFSHATAYRVLDGAIVFRVFPETRAVLQALKARGIPLGVLSNWDFRLTEVLSSLGLDEFFDFVLSSAQAGYEKPDARFFEFGLQKIREMHPQIAPRDCFYIGDHFEKDVVPSRAAGMRALWITREERDFTSGKNPENSGEIQKIHSLHDLLTLDF